ncbi:hypothetical protein THASP1DRAFT_21527 [Thamnocephalis sphaerospora]|uniref:Fanconi-associated nuclease n=1 Tax=Thamnocephalis sphaerospora TaxID=78915 RepID=A0A4P9XXN6_9FUNG|nr:hypothetical protein THASP1DRAFT_21527 [Thamnocephalis sphaerospora]|eukprot:RKP10812.1 hypothetical protein THASP1DRAFT_21527 [Thamnocephalis sphaerospora]
MFPPGEDDPCFASAGHDTQAGSSRKRAGTCNDAESLKRAQPQHSIHVHVFRDVLRVVLSHERYLFSEEECSTFDVFEQLSDAAQHLYVRLFLRKHGWIRARTLAYDGIDDVAAALEELFKAGLADGEHAVESVEEVLALLNAGELDMLVGAAGRPSSVDFDLDCKLVKLRVAGIQAFQRSHLIYYRVADPDDPPIVKALLSAFGLRQYPEYTVHRSSTVFADRNALLAYEEALAVESEIVELLAGDSDEHARWVYTRIMGHGLKALARLKRYEDEAALLCKLLDQRTYCIGARGVWYERLALVQERYLHDRRAALATCGRALEDPTVWTASQQTIQRRVLKLQRILAVPFSEQRSFTHLSIREADVIFISGVRVGTSPSGTRAVYRLGEDATEGTVEELALCHYASQGYQGLHAEGSIFTLLFWDILFSERDGAFETAEQSAPLDLATDAFYVGCRGEIDARLRQIEDVDVEHGKVLIPIRDVDEDEHDTATPLSRLYLQLISQVYAREAPRNTMCAGVSWQYSRTVLLEIARCLGGSALSAICRLLAQEYTRWSSGVPDLCLWKSSTSECKFVEVKSPNDRLSESQKVPSVYAYICIQLTR